MTESEPSALAGGDNDKTKMRIYGMHGKMSEIKSRGKAIGRMLISNINDKSQKSRIGVKVGF